MTLTTTLVTGAASAAEFPPNANDFSSRPFGAVPPSRWTGADCINPESNGFAMFAPAPSPVNPRIGALMEGMLK